MDTDYFVPIKIDTKRFVRGEEREFETSLGDYKEVGGWYQPYSFETNAKGSTNKQKITIEKIELNVPLDDALFVEPPLKGRTPAPTTAPDASNLQPKKPDEQTPPATEPKKPPRTVTLSREDGEGPLPEILRFAQDDASVNSLPQAPARVPAAASIRGRRARWSSARRHCDRAAPASELLRRARRNGIACRA